MQRRQIRASTQCLSVRNGVKLLKEWGPLTALAGLMLVSQWHFEQRLEVRFAALEQRIDNGDRRIEDRLVGLEQRVDGLTERIARVEGLLSARVAKP